MLVKGAGANAVWIRMVRSEADRKHLKGSCGTARGYATATTPQWRVNSLRSGAQRPVSLGGTVYQSMQRRQCAAFRDYSAFLDCVVPCSFACMLVDAFALRRISEEQLQDRLQRQCPVIFLRLVGACLNLLSSFQGVAVNDCSCTRDFERTRDFRRQTQSPYDSRPSAHELLHVGQTATFPAVIERDTVCPTINWGLKRPPDGYWVYQTPAMLFLS